MFYSVIFLFLCVITASPANICKNDQLGLNNGKWIFNNRSSTFTTSIQSKRIPYSHDMSLTDEKHFVCCMANGEDFRNVTENICRQTHSGYTQFSGELTHLVQAENNACACDIQANSRYTKSDREKWEWTPNDCDLPKFNATDFCHILGNRTVLYIGDSMSFLTSISLMSILTTNGVKCADQIKSGRSDFLIFQKYKTDRAFPVFIDEFKPDIVVFSTGPHLADVGDIYDVLGKIVHSVEDIRKNHRQQNITIPTFIWRTQIGGHYNCHKHTTPLTEYKEDDSELGRGDKHRYHLFPQFDRAAYEMLNNTGIRIMDVSALYLRGDAHIGIAEGKVDCMHMCIPGPLDLVSRLLYHMMKTGQV